VRALKAKGVNPNGKSWSPKLGVDAVGQLPTHHKNVQMLQVIKNKWIELGIKQLEQKWD
jgi:hypothetical protein